MIDVRAKGRQRRLVFCGVAADSENPKADDRNRCDEKEKEALGKWWAETLRNEKIAKAKNADD